VGGNIPEAERAQNEAVFESLFNEVVGAELNSMGFSRGSAYASSLPSKIDRKLVTESLDFLLQNINASTSGSSASLAAARSVSNSKKSLLMKET
jgi:hypothetical protein